MLTPGGKEGQPLSFKETPMLEGRILNLAAGESGIVSSVEAEAIVAGALGECALVTIRGQVSEEFVAGGVHYQLSGEDEGKITKIYHALRDEYQVDPKSITTSIIWGKVVDKDNKEAILRELQELGLSNYQEFRGAQGVLILADGQVLLKVPPEIREQIAAHYRWLRDFRKALDEYINLAIKNPKEAQAKRAEILKKVPEEQREELSGQMERAHWLASEINNGHLPSKKQTETELDKKNS